MSADKHVAWLGCALQQRGKMRTHLVVGGINLNDLSFYTHKVSWRHFMRLQYVYRKYQKFSTRQDILRTFCPTTSAHRRGSTNEIQKPSLHLFPLLGSSTVL